MDDFKYINCKFYNQTMEACSSINAPEPNKSKCIGNECMDYVFNETCRSCLQEHDKELKEALENILSDCYLESTGIKATKLIEWLQFWKERGIE